MRKTKPKKEKLKNSNKSSKNNEIIRIHINNKIPALWDTKVTFVSVSQFWGLTLYSSFWSISGLFITLGERKKGKNKEREENKVSLLLTLNPLSEFCWSSWMPLKEGGWTSLFSLPMVLWGWRPGLDHNIHSFPPSGPGPLWAARLKSAT